MAMRPSIRARVRPTQTWGPCGEGKVPVRRAGDVENICVLKHLRITVGRADAQVQVGACGDPVACDHTVSGGLAVAELVRRGAAQDLFDAGGDQVHVIDKTLFFRRVIVQEGQAVADQIGRGFVARVQDEDAVLDQLDLGQGAVAVALDQTGQNIGVRVTRMGGAMGDKSLKIRLEFGHRLLPGGQLRRGQDRLERAEDGQRPVAQRGAVGMGISSRFPMIWMGMVEAKSSIRSACCGMSSSRRSTVSTRPASMR